MLPATATLKAKLAEVNPYFQEHLQSDFEDEIRRRCELPNNFNDIPAVLSVNGNKSTLLKDLNIIQPPKFIKQIFDVRMEQLHIKIAVEIEKLMIEGKYKVFNNIAQNAKDLEEKGNIIFVLDNIMIEGLIPIQVEEDSFTTNKDFLLSFNPTQIITKKSWKTNDKVETSESVETDKDNTLVKSFWPGLLDTVFYIIFRDIGGPIVEYSVSEMFADEPDEMINFSNERVVLANRICDTIIQKARNIENKSSIDVQDFKLNFQAENSATSTCISFKKGKLSNILNIRRHDSFAINEESDKVLYLSGGLQIRDITLSYDDCSATHENIQSHGTSKLSPYRTKLIFKASVRKVGELYTTKLENVHFCWVRDIDYDVTGLECLSTIRDDMKSYLLSYLEGEIISKLTEHLEGVFSNILKEYDIAKEIIKH